jgi:UDP-N-acetylglucosamine--N-acetylmuramyl-(pentapeptide) pyrophosphoryl-undecaprenol N-acetylglucosamine transferase
MAGPILIMAGGTGGHVFPALAVAELLRARHSDVEWLGTRRGIEAELVPAARLPARMHSCCGPAAQGRAQLAAGAGEAC